MSRLRKASMLPPTHLTHVHQVVFRPVVKQATPSLGFRTDDGCFLLTGAGHARAGRPGNNRRDILRWPRNPLGKAYGHRTLHFHRHGKCTFPIDHHSQGTHGIRYRTGQIRRKGAFGVGFSTARVLFQLQNYYLLISKLGFTAIGDAALGVLIPPPPRHYRQYCKALGRVDNVT